MNKLAKPLGCKCSSPDDLDSLDGIDDKTHPSSSQLRQLSIDFSDLVPLAWESYYSFSMLGYEVPILGFNLVSRIFIQTTSSPARSKRCESGYIGGNDASQVSGSFTPSKWQPRFLREGVSQRQVDYKRQKESDLVTDWLVHHLLADAKKGKLPTLPMKVGQPNTLRTPNVL